MDYGGEIQLVAKTSALQEETDPGDKADVPSPELRTEDEKVNRQRPQTSA